VAKTVFTHSAITPPKVNRFGWFLTAALRTLLNKADSQSWVGEGRGSKVTGKLCELRKPRRASIYSLGLSPFVSLDHPQSAHSALCVPRSWPIRHSPVSEFIALLLVRLPIVGEGLTSNGHERLSSVVVVCNAAHMQLNSPGGSTQRASRVTSRYIGRHLVVTTLDTRWWRGRSIPHAGLGLACPSAGLRSTARLRGTSLLRPCPSRCSLMDDHPCCHCARRRSTRQDWRPLRPGGWRGSDFNVLRCWVNPVSRRRCPRESWHVACCLREIIASVKLVYSHKTFWCWLPRECANQHGSFVKLRLLSNQRRNRHIGGRVKMKRYRRPVAALHQDARGVAQIRAYALAVALAQVTWIQFQVGEIRVEFQVENWSFEYSNFV